MLRFIVERIDLCPEGIVVGRTHETFTDVQKLENCLNRGNDYRNYTLIGCEVINDKV